MGYSYDRRAKTVLLTLEFPTNTLAAEFCERFLGTVVQHHRVVEIQSGDLTEARELAKELRGREV